VNLTPGHSPSFLLLGLSSGKVEKDGLRIMNAQAKYSKVKVRMLAARKFDFVV
jgi:hypothetical protein